MKNPELAVALGKVYRLARLEKHLSQDDLAAKCGLQRASLAAVERGERAITVETAKRISDALDFRFVEIFLRLESLADIDQRDIQN